MKRYAFIYNPGAKGGRSGFSLRQIQKRAGNLPDSKIFQSQSKGDIPDLVRRLKPKYDVFVACGGDGTVREVASPLVNSDKILGILPLGSGNDLIKTLGITNNIPKAYDTLMKGRVTRVDVGRCNDLIFLNSLGFGFDGLANRFAHDFKRLPSFLRYTIAALKANFRHKQFTVTIQAENGTVQQKLIMISFANGRVEGGSFWIAPKASISDGLLRMVKVTPVNRLLIPLLLPFFLIKKPHLIPQVVQSGVSSARLKFDEIPSIHVDGEIIEPNEKEFKISIEPSALQVIGG